MALTGVIGRFATGTYAVTRKASSTYDTNGRLVAGAVTLFNVDASIQPISGRDLKVLPEAQHAEEIRVVYTTTELRTRTPSTEPDAMTIAGDSWVVIRVERWEAFGGNTSGSHYRAFIARGSIP